MPVIISILRQQVKELSFMVMLHETTKRVSPTFHFRS